jgi:hypothetical protein
LIDEHFNLFIYIFRGVNKNDVNFQNGSHISWSLNRFFFFNFNFISNSIIKNSGKLRVMDGILKRIFVENEMIMKKFYPDDFGEKPESEYDQNINHNVKHKKNSENFLDDSHCQG